MAVTAQMVKELREQTGAGMMDAKKALTETDGDMDAAVDWLRTKGLAKAAKKSGRTAAEGLVAVATRAGRGVAVELNSETDFVAKNAEFQALVAKIADAALGADTLADLQRTEIGGTPVETHITDAIAKIGENLTLRRMAAVDGQTVVTYVHNAAAENMGRIGVLVALTGGSESFGRQVAMHIAAANPAALGEADLDPAMVEKERDVQTAKALEENATAAKPKPEQVIQNNIIPGRMKKFIAESTLLGQAFVINPDLTVAQAAAEAGAEITGFVRLAVGEGIERETEDFAAEVAKVAKG